MGLGFEGTRVGSADDPCGRGPDGTQHGFLFAFQTQPVGSGPRGWAALPASGLGRVWALHAAALGDIEQRTRKK